MPRLVYPNGPQDTAGIVAYARTLRDLNTAFWNTIELQAWKNILFFLGNQRIRYSPAVRFWRPMTQDRSRLPVTNVCKTLVNDLASKLVAFKPPITWGPGSDQDADYIAATVADQVNTVIEREANIRELKPICARWMGTTGNVWLVTNYDTAPEHGMSFEPAQRCLQCLNTSMPMDREASGGLCPQCGSVEIAPDPMGMPMEAQVPRFENAMDGSGTPVGIEYPKGKHVTDVENVFTVRFDPRADRFHKSPYVTVSRSRSESWIAERYGDAFAAQAQFRVGSDLKSRLLDGIATTAFGMSGMGVSEDEPTAIVTRLWIRPHPEKAPQGIYAELVGDQIAVGRDGVPVAMAYPYQDEAGRPLLNVCHLEFDQVPGRALAATRLDDVVELQEDLNEYDAFMKQHARRMANAVWTLPRGANVSALTGEEGLYIEYDPLQTGHKPERAAGIPLGQDMILVRNQKKTEMQEVWGSSEVSRGEVPSRVSAYAALQFLDERSQQGQSNVFDNWALGWMEWSRQNLHIARQHWTEDRMLSLGVGRWASQKFSRAQIQGGVDISVDLGMNRPITLIAKAARIGQAITQGLVNPMDPQQRFQGLRALGIPELMPDYNQDYIKAGRMLDYILQAQTPEEMLQLAPAPQPYDIHPIHLQVLRQFEVTEQFEALEDWKKQAIQLRALIHFQAMQQAMAGQGGPVNNRGPMDGGGGEGGGGEGEKEDYTTEDTILDKETQGASPDSMTGAKAEMALGA